MILLDSNIIILRQSRVMMLYESLLRNMNPESP